MLHGCLHEDATWENRHALRWELGYKATRCTARMGFAPGPENKNWRVLPRDGGPTDAVVKVFEAIYLY